MFIKHGCKLQITKIASSLKDILGKNLITRIDEDKKGVSNDDFVYFAARALTADVANANGDLFEASELKKSYETFIGKGLYLNHDAADVSKSVGRIVDAWFIDEDPNDIHVVCLCKVDTISEPIIARKVECGIMDSVSMGCSVLISVCSICGNEASEASQFCSHMKNLGREITTEKGERKKVISINRGITFSELSLVGQPADENAVLLEIYAKADDTKKAELKKWACDRGLGNVLNKESALTFDQIENGKDVAEWIKQVETLSGFKSENLGGNVVGFVIPNTNYTFGYGDTKFSYDVIVDGESTKHEMIPYEDTIENEAKWMKEVINGTTKTATKVASDAFDIYEREHPYSDVINKRDGKIVAIEGNSATLEFSDNTTIKVEKNSDWEVGDTIEYGQYKNDPKAIFVTKKSVLSSTATKERVVVTYDISKLSEDELKKAIPEYSFKDAKDGDITTIYDGQNTKNFVWAGGYPKLEEVTSEMNNKKAALELKAWKGKLQKNYDDLEEFKSYDELYGLAKRLGFETAEEAWNANPTVSGSTNPADYKVVEDKKTATKDPSVMNVAIEKGKEDSYVVVTDFPNIPNSEKSYDVFEFTPLNIPRYENEYYVHWLSVPSSEEDEWYDLVDIKIKELAKSNGIKLSADKKAAGNGMLDGDQSDTLDAIVMQNKGKSAKEILELAKAKGKEWWMFEPVDGEARSLTDTEMLEAIEGSITVFGNKVADAEPKQEKADEKTEDVVVKKSPKADESKDESKEHGKSVKELVKDIKEDVKDIKDDVKQLEKAIEPEVEKEAKKVRASKLYKDKVELKKKADDTLLASYDESDIIDSNVEYCKENWEESKERYGLEGTFEENKKKVVDEVAQDPDLFAMSWEGFVEDVATIFKGYYHISAKNLGWRNQSGEATVEVNSFDDLRNKVLPKTQDMTINIYEGEKAGELKMTVSHHDAPTGDTYYFTPVKALETGTKVKTNTGNTGKVTYSEFVDDSFVYEVELEDGNVESDVHQSDVTVVGGEAKAEVKEAGLTAVDGNGDTIHSGDVVKIDETDNGYEIKAIEDVVGKILVKLDINGTEKFFDPAKVKLLEKEIEKGATEKEEVNGYKIWLNDLRKHWIVDHPEIGAGIAEFDTKEEAIDFAKRGETKKADTRPPQPDNTTLSPGMKWVFNSQTNVWEQKPTTEKTVEVSAAEDNDTVKCNNCGWSGTDEELKMIDDNGEFIKGCPKCDMKDHALMDIEADTLKTHESLQDPTEYKYASKTAGDKAPYGFKKIADRKDEQGNDVYEAYTEDLILLIDNEQPLYNRLVDAYKNLSRKMKKGVYDSSLAPKLFSYIVDVAAKQWYQQTVEWADDGKSTVIRPSKEVRDATAVEMAKRFEEAYKNKEYDFMGDDKKEAGTDKDVVTISKKDSNFMSEYNRLKGEGYKVDWTGEGKIQLSKAKADKKADLDTDGEYSAQDIAETFINGNISTARREIGNDIGMFNEVLVWLEDYAPDEVESFRRLMTKGASKKQAGVNPNEEEGSTVRIKRTKNKGLTYEHIMQMSKDEVDALPTIHQGQYADLKLDDGEHRVWVSRMTKADGAKENNAVEVETLENGSWVEANKKQASDRKPKLSKDVQDGKVTWYGGTMLHHEDTEGHAYDVITISTKDGKALTEDEAKKEMDEYATELGKNASKKTAEYDGPEYRVNSVSGNEHEVIRQSDDKLMGAFETEAKAEQWIKDQGIDLTASVSKKALSGGWMAWDAFPDREMAESYLEQASKNAGLPKYQDVDVKVMEHPEDATNKFYIMWKPKGKKVSVSKSASEVDLPFGARGINLATLEVSEDEVSYTLNDGAEVSCPKQGGVWLNGTQVSGTADKPFRFILQTAESLLEKKDTNLSRQASAFDKVEKIDVAEGIFATKNKETQEIEIKNLDGKVLETYPDAFGDEIVPIVKLLSMIYAEDVKKHKKHEESETKKKEEKEASLKAELHKAKTELLTLQFTASYNEKRVKCEKLATEAFDKGLLSIDMNYVIAEVKKDRNSLEVEAEAKVLAIKKQVKTLMQSEDTAIEAYASTVNSFTKTASRKVKASSALQTPFVGSAEFTDENTIENISKSLPWSRNR